MISEAQRIEPRKARCKGYDGLLDIPMTEIPTEPNGLHSPSIGNPHSVPRPIYPEDSGFDEILDEVKQVRAQVRLREWPTEFLAKSNPSGSDGDVPKYLRTAGVFKSSPVTAARLVAMDDPTDVGLHLFKVISHNLMKSGVPFKNEYAHIPFVEEFGRFQAILGQELYEILKAAFEVKYYYGLERPETVIGIPGCVFCDNDTGCPPHLSYIAGHGAVFGRTEKVIMDFFEFENHHQELLDVRDALWQGSQYRLLLGVHYSQDNIEGYIFGRTHNA